MTNQILAALVSTVAMEQEFSVDGNILDATRYYLSFDSIQAQTYLDDWIKVQYRQQEIDQKPSYKYFENDQTTGTESSDD